MGEFVWPTGLIRPAEQLDYALRNNRSFEKRSRRLVYGHFSPIRHGNTGRQGKTALDGHRANRNQAEKKLATKKDWAGRLANIAHTAVNTGCGELQG